MSSPFWFVAGLLTGVAATSIVIPLWRGVGRTGVRAMLYVAGGIAVFTAVAVGLYLVLGSPREAATSEAANAHHEANVSTPAPTAPSMEEATAQLQARLDRDGGSSDDWQLLAQSYEFLGRPQDAERARAHVTSGSATPNTAHAPNETAALNADADHQERDRLGH